MADWRATSDWTARMRETPNLARNTVFVEEAAPKAQTQPPHRGGRPGAPPSGIRDGDWQCPECPNVNFARRMECHRCGAPRPYEPRKPRARQLRDDEEPRYRRPRDRSEERDRHRRRSRSRSRDGGRKVDRGRQKGEPPKEDNWRCGHCQNDNWGWRKVRFHCLYCVITTHRSATAARSRGPRTSRRVRAAAGASTSATTRRTGARRRRTRTMATTTSGEGRSPRRARPSARRVGSVGGTFKLRSAFHRRALYCVVLNAGRGARAAPGRARPALMASRPGGVRRPGATPVT